jgi:hypothetical protein
MSFPRSTRDARVLNMREQRPGIPPHAFTESGVQGMGHGEDSYGGFAQDQRMLFPPASMSEMQYDDGRHALHLLLGGFAPGFGHNPHPPSFRRRGHFHEGPD